MRLKGSDTTAFAGERPWILRAWRGILGRINGRPAGPAGGMPFEATVCTGRLSPERPGGPPASMTPGELPTPKPGADPVATDNVTAQKCRPDTSSVESTRRPLRRFAPICRRIADIERGAP